MDSAPRRRRRKWGAGFAQINIVILLRSGSGIIGATSRRSFTASTSCVDWTDAPHVRDQEIAAGSYAAYGPRLPRGASVGTYEAEAVRKIQGSIRLHIESLRRHRRPVRKPRRKSTVVNVVAVVGQVKERSSGFGVTKGGRLE